MFNYEVEYIVNNEIKIDIITLEHFYSDCISDFIADKIKQIEDDDNFEIQKYREIERIYRHSYEKDILFNETNTRRD